MKYPPLIALALAALSLSGQTTEDGDVTRSFSLIAWDSPVREIFYRSQEQDVPIRAFPRRRSDPFRYTGPRELVFFRKRENAEGEIVRKPVGRFEFADDTREWLFLVRSDEDGQLQVAGFPANELTDSGAGYYFINLSSEPVAGSLAGSTFRLAIGESRLIKPPAETENGSTQVKFAIREAETWELFYETFWPLRPNQRWIVLVHPDGNERPRLTKIKERIDADDG